MVTRTQSATPARKTARRQAAEAIAPAAQQAGQAARTAARVVQKNVQRAASGMLGISGERMSKVDTAWLRMDSASNLMMIVGVWTLKPGISYEALCQRVEERLLKYDRFRQRVLEDAAGATWVNDRNFDIAHHVVRETLPKVAHGDEQRALQDRVGELAMQPLDHKRPLWQFHLVEDYQGGSVLLVRIHHCIADGISLISVTMSLVDGGACKPARRMSIAKDGINAGNNGHSRGQRRHGRRPAQRSGRQPFRQFRGGVDRAAFRQEDGVVGRRQQTFRVGDGMEAARERRRRVLEEG